MCYTLHKYVCPYVQSELVVRSEDTGQDVIGKRGEVFE